MLADRDFGDRRRNCFSRVVRPVVGLLSPAIRLAASARFAVKHERIKYAVAISPAGAVQQIEILEYNESYGYEVRDPAWRQQFVGKSAGSTLKLRVDIKNISGATLSCKHVTDGVKRVLVMYELALRHAP